MPPCYKVNVLVMPGRIPTTITALATDSYMEACEMASQVRQLKWHHETSGFGYYKTDTWYFVLSVGIQDTQSVICNDLGCRSMGHHYHEKPA